MSEENENFDENREAVRNSMRDKIENIARAVIREEMKTCPNGIEQAGQIDEHERRLSEMNQKIDKVEKSAADVAEKIFEKIDIFKTEVMRYWIGILGVIIAELVTIIVAVALKVIKFG